MDGWAMVRGLVIGDLLNVARDPLLRGLIGLPLAVAAAVRWPGPGLMTAIGTRLDLDLLAVYPLLVGGVVVLLGPAVGGLVVGFLLLDQRDERTLLALRVTPMPLAGYLAYRLGAPTLIGLLMTLLAVPLAGLSVAPPLLLGVAVLAALMTPLLALGLALIAPLLGLVLPWPWWLLLGLVPTSWPVALLWSGWSGGPTVSGWLLGLGGLAYTGLLIGLLLRRWQAALQR